MTMEETLTRLFDLLSDWRRLPAYQLERRADIFFALYLEDLLKYGDNKYFEKDETVTIIPEFPAKHTDTNQSDRIDYMVCSERKVVYVELKTDNHSIRTEQAEYLLNIQQRALKDVLENIIAIYRATNARTRTKYRELIKKLDRWIERHETEAGKEHYTLRYDEIAKVESVEVVYILPTSQEIKYNPKKICFDEIVKMLRLPKYADDPIAQAFAEALAKWAE